MTQPENTNVLEATNAPTNKSEPGCLGCLGMIFMLMLIFNGCSSLFTSDSSSSDSSGVCVGNACWDSKEDLERDVCAVDPSLKGCDKYKN
jgi:uncharacterized protein YceK